MRLVSFVATEKKNWRQLSVACVSPLTCVKSRQRNHALRDLIWAVCFLGVAVNRRRISREGRFGFGFGRAPHCRGKTPGSPTPLGVAGGKRVAAAVCRRSGRRRRPEEGNRPLCFCCKIERLVEEPIFLGSRVGSSPGRPYSFTKAHNFSLGWFSSRLGRVRLTRST